MEKILKREIPPITSYPIIANMMSVLWPHKDKVMPWFCDRFINLVGRKETHSRFSLHGVFYDYEIAHNTPLFLTCPFIETSRFHRNMIKDKEKNFSEFAKYCVDNGYYVHVCLDNYRIPATVHYQERHFIHPTFIYGYENEKQEFYASDFLNGAYEFFSITSENLNLSYDFESDVSEYKSFIPMITTMKYVDYDYKFNIDKVIRDYNDFLNGEDGSRFYKNDYKYGDLNFSFGIRYYDAMEHDILKEHTDIRVSHVLYDHKVATEMRVRYMMDNGYLKSEELYEQSKEMTRQALNLRNLVLKQKITGRDIEKERAATLCRQLRSKDEEFVRQLLSNIKL